MTHEKKIKPLGVVLKEKGLITDEYIGYALQEQKITHEKIGEILERLGFVTENDIVVALSEQSGVPYIDVDTILPEENILKLFNKKLCLNNIFLPFRKTDNLLEIAAHNLIDEKLGQTISRQTGLLPKFYISERKKIVRAVNKFYYFLENPVEKLIEKEVYLLSQNEEMA
ncbi:MAG: hypothetical protein WBC36_06720, partial [Desulfobacterales bacterium]